MQARISTVVLLTLCSIATKVFAQPATRPIKVVEQQSHVSGSAPTLRSEDTRRSEQPAEPIFSGPQVGEKLPPLPVRGVFDEEAGKDLDFAIAAADKPVVLIFVHEMSRPSIGMTRALGNYAGGRSKDGLTTGIVWLDGDATEAENTLKRIRHALPRGVAVGISMDGKEGPGSYGLNRNVALTILVGNEGTVTDNFALVQPSLQADLPKIVAAIVRQVGGQVPPLSELIERPEMMRGTGSAGGEEQLRVLLRPVIRRDATESDVDRAAEAVESFLKENAAAQAEVGRIAQTIVNSGKLSNYGTPRAQEHLRRWAEKYGEQALRKTEQRADEESSGSSPEAPAR